jgi:hypothetical protein
VEYKRRLTISKSLSVGQARTYHSREFTSEKQNYWSRDQQAHSEWQGRLAQEWGLHGEVGSEHFARLSEGHHPESGLQLVKHLVGGRKQYTLEITTQPLVMASEIAGLEPLHGYIKQENYVVRVCFPYVAPIEKQPRFIERAVSVSPRSVAIQQAAVNSQQASKAPDQPPRKPVQKQRVFLGAVRQKAGNEKPRDWDESEWIE